MSASASRSEFAITESNQQEDECGPQLISKIEVIFFTIIDIAIT